MSDYYDVIIAGGSVSGLLAGREIAAKGLSVAILEEDAEIGTPEHCGGIVSINGIQNLGIIPSSNAIENKIKYARIASSSKIFELNAEEQKVIVLDRRVFDKQIAFQTQRLGGNIRVRCSMRSISRSASSSAPASAARATCRWASFPSPRTCSWWRWRCGCWPFPTLEGLS